MQYLKMYVVSKRWLNALYKGESEEPEFEEVGCMETDATVVALAA